VQIHCAKPADRWKRYIARAIDVVAAVAGILFFAPILLITVIAIKVDSPGPLLVREVKNGPKNRPVELLRFRLRTAPTPGNPNHQRLTRLGDLLRGSRIDELAKMFNVLIGETTIVSSASIHRLTMLLFTAVKGTQAG
jgi:lipopolysaccharide/colanic/teichoic acid biosynthesis glycosyltransferase